MSWLSPSVVIAVSPGVIARYVASSCVLTGRLYSLPIQETRPLPPPQFFKSSRIGKRQYINRTSLNEYAPYSVTLDNNVVFHSVGCTTNQRLIARISPWPWEASASHFHEPGWIWTNERQFVLGVWLVKIAGGSSGLDRTYIQMQDCTIIRQALWIDNEHAKNTEQRKHLCHAVFMETGPFLISRSRANYFGASWE